MYGTDLIYTILWPIYYNYTLLYSFIHCYMNYKLWTNNIKKYYNIRIIYEAQSVTVKSTGCGFNRHPRKWNIYLHLYFHFFVLVSRQSAVLIFATQHAISPELGGKWGTECLNTRFLLPCCVRDIAWSSKKNIIYLSQ